MKGYVGRNDNYPDDIRNYDWHPASPFYEEPVDEDSEDDDYYDGPDDFYPECDNYYDGK